MKSFSMMSDVNSSRSHTMVWFNLFLTHPRTTHMFFVPLSSSQICHSFVSALPWSFYRLCHGPWAFWCILSPSRICNSTCFWKMRLKQFYHWCFSSAVLEPWLFRWYLCYNFWFHILQDVLPSSPPVLRPFVVNQSNRQWYLHPVRDNAITSPAPAHTMAPTVTLCNLDVAVHVANVIRGLPKARTRRLKCRRHNGVNEMFWPSGLRLYPIDQTQKEKKGALKKKTDMSVKSNLTFQMSSDVRILGCHVLVVVSPF